MSSVENDMSVCMVAANNEYMHIYIYILYILYMYTSAYLHMYIYMYMYRYIYVGTYINMFLKPTHVLTHMGMVLKWLQYGPLRFMSDCHTGPVLQVPS